MTMMMTMMMILTPENFSQKDNIWNIKVKNSVFQKQSIYTTYQA